MNGVPSIAGFVYVEDLGSGGNGSVHLYRQVDPGRLVAVKVASKADCTDGHAGLAHEAAMMARLAGHPSIVPLFEVGVTDDGRRHLVMERHGADFQARVCAERFDIPDVVRIGVQLAGAVETVHRSGVVHGDIKPANVVTSHLGTPALTDFGLASLLAEDERSIVPARRGVSIPWTAPEVLAGAAPDVPSDIWSLAAVLHHLLCGHAPFERPGEPNRAEDQLLRIGRVPLVPTGRNAELDALLAAAMSPHRSCRPVSAAEFGRALNEVECSLGLPTTPLEIPQHANGSFPSELTNDRDSTRPNFGHIDAQSAAPPTVGSARRRSATLMVGAALVVLFGVVLMARSGRPDDARRPLDAPPIATSEVGPDDSAGQPDSIDGLAVQQREGDLEFSWNAPTARLGDVYVFRYLVDGAATDGKASATSVRFATPDRASTACLVVFVRRTGTPDSGAKEVCTSI